MSPDTNYLQEIKMLPRLPETGSGVRPSHDNWIAASLLDVPRPEYSKVRSVAPSRASTSALEGRFEELASTTITQFAAVHSALADIADRIGHLEGAVAFAASGTKEPLDWSTDESLADALMRSVELGRFLKPALSALAQKVLVDSTRDVEVRIAAASAVLALMPRDVSLRVIERLRSTTQPSALMRTINNLERDIFR